MYVYMMLLVSLSLLTKLQSNTSATISQTVAIYGAQHHPIDMISTNLQK
jgi:hypothetical protein